MRSSNWQRVVASLAFVLAFAAAIVGGVPSAQAAPSAAHLAITGKTTHATPGMVANGGTLYVAYTGTDSSHHIYMDSSTNGVNFSQVTINDEALAGTGPALCLFNGHVYVVFMGTNGHLYVGWYNPGDTALHDHTSIPNSGGFDQTSFTPACAADGSQLYIAWTGPDNLIRMRRSSDGTTWSSSNRWVMTETANSGVGLASYPASGGTQQLGIVWAGTDTLHHLNWGFVTDNFGDMCQPGDPVGACQLSAKDTDMSNYTNTEPQLVNHGTNTPYMTWKSATSNTIYGRSINTQLQSINGAVSTFSGSSSTGIALANWSGSIYGAWGGSDAGGTLNVAVFFA